MDSAPLTSPQQKQLHIRLVHEARTYWRLFTWVIAAGTIGSLAGIGIAWGLSQAVSTIFLRGKTISDIYGQVIVLLLLIFGRGLFTWASEAASSKLAIQIKSSLRERLFSYILNLGPAYTQRSQTGNLVNNLTEGIEALGPYYNQYLPQAVFAVVTPLIVLLCVTPIDPLSGLILLFTAPIIPIFMVLLADLSTTLTQRQYKTLSRLSAYFLDVLQGLTTLKILGQSKAQIKEISRISDRFRDITMKVLRVTFLSALVMEFTATLSTAIIAVEVGIRLLYGKIGFEQAFFILILVPEFYLPLRLLGLRFHSGMAGVAAARPIFEILDEPLALARKTNASQNRLDSQHLVPHSVRFHRVSYAYSQDQPVLKDISFSIESGQKVAVVGPSGAGKSTIASLLLRFFAPQQGQILADGVDIEDFPIDVWREKVAWVPQKPYLFDDTIAANIRLARPGASLQEVQTAAKLAHADAFIHALPEGYDTKIGERGLRLSGGQAQRVALARAFLKDAPLLVLDEPTSNLDPLVETQLQDSLQRLVKDRLVLMIAHRLSTVYQSDRILVLDEGKIVEAGSHLELIDQGGLYQKLIQEGAILNQDETVTAGPSLPPEGERYQLEPEATTELSSLIEQSFVKTKVRNPILHLLSLLAPVRSWVFLSILLGFLAVVSSIGLMSTSTYIISAAALHPSIAALQVAIVGVRFFGITRALFRYLERLVSHQVTFKLLAQLRVWIFRVLEPLAPARLIQSSSGDLLSRVIRDVGSLENFYVRGAAPSIIALLTTLGMAWFMFPFSAWLSLLIVIFMALGGLALPLWVWRASQLPGAQTIRLSAQLSTLFVDHLQGLSDLTAFGQVAASDQKIRAKMHNLSLVQSKTGGFNSLQNALTLWLANLALWSVLIFGAILVQQKQIDGVLLGVLCLAAMTSFEAIQALPQAAVHIGKDMEAAQRLLEISQLQPAINFPAHPLPKPQSFELDIKNLSFSYPSESGSTPSRTSIPFEGDLQKVSISNVLTEISFSINPNQHIAIVGQSGAGKSTLVNLLLRFWDYSTGRILFGGKDIRLYDPEQLRGWISVVPQNTHLFTNTIQGNFLLAKPQASLAEIEQVIQQAQLQEFIQSLPQGYQTWIGEQGLRLSAGERQRLALARAFLRDAPLLILDEPTANLDTLLEQKILHSIRQFCTNRMRLTITHRLVGLEDADEILVIQDGKIVERGRHAALVQQGGLYRQMWDLQNQPRK